MSGTIKGGRAAAATNVKKYGEDFYRAIGQKGGSAVHKTGRGFASKTIGRDGLTGPERASTYGAIGGRISRKSRPQ